MKKYAILLPGQGSQYIGMGKELYENYSSVKKIYDDANDLLNFNIRDLCFNGDFDELSYTENAQPAILLAGVSAYKIFVDEVGRKPDFICGHSIGEITALTCAGMIDLNDAIKIVRKRGELMGGIYKEKKGIMAAIMDSSIEVIEKTCQEITFEYGEYVGIANYNSYDQIVISGYENAVKKAIEKLEQLNSEVEAVILKVKGAYHSPLMKPIITAFEDELKKYKFNESDIKVVSNIDALPYKSKDEIVERLTKQIVSSVKWVQSMEYLNENNVKRAIDVGPKSVVKKLLKRSGINIKSYAFEDERDRKRSVKRLQRGTSCSNVGMESEAKKFEHTIVSKCISIAVCTQNKNKDAAQYQKGYVEPYRKMKDIQELIERESRTPNKEECLEVLNLLKKIFESKKTSKEEVSERFLEISLLKDFRELGINFEWLNNK